ncbi:MAG: nucleotidyltransferase family protein [Microthrixaceae bacterium]
MDPRSVRPIDGAPATTEELAALRTALADHWTARALTAFAEADLPVVLLKGPAVARWLYPDEPRWRPYVDVDLLVRASDQSLATELLTGLGYAQASGIGTRHGTPSHATDWRRSSDGALIDLHTSLHGLTLLPPDTVWAEVSDGAETIAVNGVTATIPGPPMRALHLALHLVPKYGPEDQPWRDLVRAVEVVDSSVWHAAAARARRLGVEDLLGTNLRRIGPSGASLADALALSSLPSRDVWHKDARQRVRWLDELRALPGMRSKLRFAVELALPRPSLVAKFARIEDPSVSQLAVLYLRRLARVPFAAGGAARDYVRAERRRSRASTQGAGSARDLPLLRTTGTSMVPALQLGDVLIIDPARTRPTVGDIAVFRRDEGLVVHRVLSRTHRLQMGDATRVATRYLPGDVEGTVVARVRGADRHDLRTPASRLRGVGTAMRLRVALSARGCGVRDRLTGRGSRTSP